MAAEAYRFISAYSKFAPSYRCFVAEFSGTLCFKTRLLSEIQYKVRFRDRRMIFRQNFAYSLSFRYWTGLEWSFLLRTIGINSVTGR